MRRFFAGAGWAATTALICTLFGEQAKAISSAVNLSTRMVVQTGDNVMIGGFIVRGDVPKRTIVRARGPSLFLNGAPIAGRLMDPALELRDANGALIKANDNWRSDQQAEIAASSIAPTDDTEPAVVWTLTPGNYTTIVRGVNNTTGIALVEMYDLDQPPSADRSYPDAATRFARGHPDRSSCRTFPLPGHLRRDGRVDRPGAKPGIRRVPERAVRRADVVASGVRRCGGRRLAEPESVAKRDPESADVDHDERRLVDQCDLRPGSSPATRRVRLERDPRRLAQQRGTREPALRLAHLLRRARARRVQQLPPAARGHHAQPGDGRVPQHAPERQGESGARDFA